MNSDGNKKSPFGWLPKGLDVQEYKLKIMLDAFGNRVWEYNNTSYACALALS